MSSIDNIIPPKYFVGLHAHDGSSVYDGLGYPNEHIDFVLENGMNAFALTNHGHMNSAAHAHNYAKKLKKKGQEYRHIYGCECYFVDSLDEWQNDYNDHREKVRSEREEKKREQKEREQKKKRGKKEREKKKERKK